jgi:hypothetical protein
MDLQSFTDAFRRYASFVARPEDEWNVVVAENPPLTEVLFPFTTIGLVVSLLAGLLGSLLRTAEHSIAIDVAVKLAVDAGSVTAFVVASGLVSRRVDAVRPQMGEIAALYSCAGMWMASVLGFVPVPVLGWLWLLIGAAYTGYLYYVALDVVVGVPDHSRLRAFLLPMGGLLIVSSALRVAGQMLVG